MSQYPYLPASLCLSISSHLCLQSPCLMKDNSVSLPRIDTIDAIDIIDDRNNRRNGWNRRN